MTAYPKRPRIVNAKCLPFDQTPLRMDLHGVRGFGVCPLCHQSATLSRAHVVAKGQYGDDVPENMAWICGDGVMGCHGLLTHGNRVIGHPIDVDEARARFVDYCRFTVPELGEYADRAKWPGWLEDTYLGAAERKGAA